MQRLFGYLFASLFFVTPLILWPYTSEVFEFNKIVFVYILTIIITTVWAIHCIIERKFIFRRTILDIPLLFFLGSQMISTILSIDSRTSFFGYYSRFNGGLLSTVSYLLLYWAFVSNMDVKSTLFSLKALILSAMIASFYGILEHFGIDKNIWVQDVQNRVFSTLGQPNWLAAFLVALIPLTWTNLVKKPYGFLLSSLFFITLLFTKSRSGLLGFIIADIIYWGLILIKDKKRYLKSFFTFQLLFLIIFFVIGNPFKLLTTPQSSTGTALETGGTESGTIRKIVWKGAIEIWKNYPIFGTGPETFGYIYFKFRPEEHNLVSEWDFIYNKAHNEFLNIAANTGSAGLISYLIAVIASYKIFIKKKRFEYMAGYTGLIVSNFFGFSVVPTQLILFLFPAITLTINEE